jgi:predicted CXXCH cytochrome family protein
MRVLRLAATSSAFALVALLSAASAGGADGRAASSSLEPAIQHALRGPCVAEPALMRRQHPDMLKHQRLETVHLGVRETRASLKACVSCHASAETGSVAAAPTDFCVSCHSYAAVQVDCFECHASKPQGPQRPGHP